MTDLPTALTAAELGARPVPDFAAFTNDDAVDLGLIAVGLIRERDLDLAVEIVLRDVLVFRAMLKSTGADNEPWLRGKAAAARHFGVPSLLVRLTGGELPPEPRAHDAGLAADEQAPEEMRAYGGAIPLRVRGEVVGTITASGEPDVVDDAVAAEAIRRYLLARDQAETEPSH